MFDLDFQGHAIKNNFFHYHQLDSVTPKTYPLEIFSKNSDEKAKIQGDGSTHPLGRFWLGKYLECLGGLNSEKKT